MEGLFPSKCIGCQIKDEILCDNCLSKIERTERQINDQIMTNIKTGEGDFQKYTNDTEFDNNLLNY